MTIKDFIMQNFKDSSEVELRESIDASIESGDEEALPGLGVMFTLLYQNSDKEEIIKTLKKAL